MKHTASISPDNQVTCPLGCNLGTSAHAPDRAAAERRVELHELATAGYQPEPGKAIICPYHGLQLGIACPVCTGIDTDDLAEKIVTAIGEWADGDPDRIRFAEAWVARTPTLEGSRA